MSGSIRNSPEKLRNWLREAHAWTRLLVDDLSDDQWMGPQLEIVNPLRWEIGHLAWFQEKWVLRGVRGREPIRRDADHLYDSTAIPHDSRWSLPLPSRSDTFAYLDRVREEVLAATRDDRGDEMAYFATLSLFHHDMHNEAFAYTRQTLGYPPPAPLASHETPAPDPGMLTGDASVPGGRFLLGAVPSEDFVFDNEKWAHEVEIRPFRIARAPVTQREFAAFVDDGGYVNETNWSHAGRSWRETQHAEHPVYWRRENGAWLRRDFDRWVPLEPHRPVIHVNAFEADAYCRWAGRRLPTEAEWEASAAGEPNHGCLADDKRLFPWGGAPPDRETAHVDGRNLGCVDVAACSRGESAFGCRQLIGNVWEWTQTDFGPYPGFVADPYKEYSAPWFGSHRVLRGGSWVTRGRLLRNTWRNYYLPHRRDPWVGFRTCALLDSRPGA